MKQFYTLLLWALAMVLPSAANAAPVKVEKAKAVAVDFFAKSTPTRAAVSLELVWDGEDAVTRGAEEPALFVFNRTDGPGFVMVAGDDASAPILGYSFENSFGDPNQMPAHMKWWFDGYAKMIRAARAAGLQPNAGWVQKPAAGAPVRELQTALWDQGAPFNNECPTIPGGKAVSGCVQTAAGIVMKYHRWPTNPTGTIPGYISSPHNISMPARELKPYNWDLMLDNYTGTYTAEQGAEVARLMVDLGTGNKAMYNSATGAFTSYLVSTLGTYMQYNKGMRLAYRDSYSDEEWAALIRNEIDHHGPVIYSGYGNEGGHAFVLDGYADDGTFRFNWGWSGTANGYYSVYNMVPNGSGYNFGAGQEIIRDLYPDKEGATVATDDLKLVAAQLSDGSVCPGLYAFTTNFVKGQPFEAMVTFLNLSTQTYSGRVGLAVYSQSGALKEVLYEATTSLGGVTQNGELSLKLINPKNCVITNTIARGDRLRAIFWDRGAEAWVPMDCYESGAQREIVISPETLDAKTIAAGSSIAYDRTTKQLTLQTYAELTYQITSAEGQTVQSGASEGKAMSFEMAAGSYTLSITDPAAETNGTYSVRLKF